jgi:SAM-dependent methyltransferase
LADRRREVKHVNLGEQVAAAWSRTNGSMPHRVMMLGTNVLIRAEEDLTDVYFRARGLRTTGMDPDMHGAGAGSNLMGYVPIRWRPLRELFRSWPVAPGGVLLDYGSGKGRATIWAAANYRFQRIIGVELDAQLHASAQANLARWKGRRLCDDVELVRADATEFEVPDDVTTIFFANPFTGSIFEKVLGKIQESLDRNPRELVILYYHARMHDSLVNAGFTPERQQVVPPNDWATYRRPK